MRRYRFHCLSQGVLALIIEFLRRLQISTLSCYRKGYLLGNELGCVVLSDRHLLCNKLGYVVLSNRYLLCDKLGNVKSK
jgi:hypothetical protein